MRNTLNLFVLLVFSSFSLVSFAKNHPEANYGIYGIQHHNTLSEYQRYVGETVIYLPEENPSYNDITEFKGEFNTQYIIIKINGNEKKNRLSFILQEKGSKKNIKMVIYNYEVYYSFGEYTYCITESYSVPLFLIDKFNNDKSKYIGKTYSNEKVITEYEIVDVEMKFHNDEYSPHYSSYPILHYILKNSITGNQKAYPAANAEILCFIHDLDGSYISRLVKVEKPEDESVRYGETKIVEIEGITKYRYIDDFIDILIFSGSENFSFLLKNISQNTLKLIWNEAVFVDFNGNTSKVMHIGTKYSQKDADQPPSTIIKGAHIDDVAIPTSNISYSDILKKWYTNPMYPIKPATSPGEIRLMLPIQVKDVINEYIFVFKVDWVYNHPNLLKKGE